MNGNSDGGFGVYGPVVVDALMELGRLLNETSQRQNGSQGFSWKRVTLALAAIVVPVALLLAAGLGS